MLPPAESPTLPLPKINRNQHPNRGAAIIPVPGSSALSSTIRQRGVVLGPRGHHAARIPVPQPLSRALGRLLPERRWPSAGPRPCWHCSGPGSAWLRPRRLSGACLRWTDQVICVLDVNVGFYVSNAWAGLLKFCLIELSCPSIQNQIEACEFSSKLLMKSAKSFK